MEEYIEKQLQIIKNKRDLTALNRYESLLSGATNIDPKVTRVSI